MNKKMSKADWIIETFLILIGVIILVVILYPLLNMVAESLSATGPVKRGEIGIWPKQFTLEAYKVVLTNTKILRALGNSIFLTIVDCIAKIFMVYLAAYPLAHCDFPGKKAWSLLIMVAMWISAGTIPRFMTIKDLGLYDTYFALILLGLVSPYNIMVTRNFLKGIPKELVDSARVDGAKEFRIMWSIMAPLSKPIFATLAIWTISGTWNSYMEPTIYLASSEKFVLQQVLRSIVLEAEFAAFDMAASAQGSADISYQIASAVVIVSTIPMIIMYPFAQKHFVKGAVVGSVKG